MVGSAADVDRRPRRLDDLVGRRTCGRGFALVLPGNDIRGGTHADFIHELGELDVSRARLTTARCGFALEVLDL